jgi:hypothetical protein
MASVKTMMLLMLLLAPLCLGQDASGVPSTPGQGVQTQATTADYSRPGEDFQPASGAQPFSLGVGERKELDISLFATQSWDSIGYGGNANGTNWQPNSSFGGSLQLALDRKNSQTVLNYNGHAIAYPDREPVWNSYQTLGFSHSVRIGRWALTAIDSFSLSPNSPFGGYGFGLPGGGSAAGQPILNAQYFPNQSILTSYATNYFNSTTGQLSYGLSRRSSVTASVAYGILRFTGSSFQNSNQVTASTGYNYSLTAKDSISATYSFGRIAFTGSNYVSHTMQLGYSHKLNGRFSLLLSGGPEVIDTANLGFSGVRVQSSGNASLLYSKARTSLSLSYFRGTTGGSGVLAGATTQSAQVSIGQEISKAWTTSLAVGYANNSGLVQQQNYNAVYISPGMRRAVTRNLGLTFNYSYQHQVASSNCVLAVCGNVGGNFLSVGVDYRFRPIRLE